MKPKVLKKSTKAIKRVGFFADSFSTRGLSNTPSITYRMNLSYDYFKFSFIKDFDPFSPFILGLLKILKVSPVIYEEMSGVFGYDKRIVYNENITFLYQAKQYSKTIDGEENFIFEMKGQACLEFDERNGSWYELLNYCLINDGKATRIDFAIDDLTNDITIEQLKSKFYKKQYTSRMKRIILIGGGNILDDTLYDEYEAPRLIESNNQGFTLTFGSKTTKELCIYNKKAERISKRVNVYVSSWLRYEARFYKIYADKVAHLVLASYLKNNVEKLILNLFSGLVVFREDNDFSFDNQYKAPVWSKWAQIIDYDKNTSIKITNKSKFEKTLTSRLNWFRSSVGIILKELYLADPINFESNIKYFLLNKPDSFNNNNVANVNKVRIALGKTPYKNDGSALFYLNENVSLDDESDLINYVFDIDK